jgi:predicted lipoprotein
MTGASVSGRRGRLSLSRRQLIWTGVVIVLLGVIASGVKVVDINSPAGAGAKKFSAAEFGQTQFPKVQEAITKRAVPASTLAAAIAADPTAAGKKYGVAAGIGPELSVSFTGVVGKGTDGIYQVEVAGVPANLIVRVQTGPAINGTDLRDATGTISFGQFVNQIDYQNAAAALNDQLKQKVLSKIDTASLTGKTISVVGAFQLINPQGWLVTPATVTVK